MKGLAFGAARNIRAMHCHMQLGGRGKHSPPEDETELVMIEKKQIDDFVEKHLTLEDLQIGPRPSPPPDLYKNESSCLQKSNPAASKKRVQRPPTIE